MRSRALQGMAASSAAQAVRLAVQLGSVVVLSRLLQPSDFGLLAMVAPAYGAVVLVQDLGLSQATVQAPQITAGQLSNLFWTNVAVSIGLAGALAAAAPALARFYGEPRAAGLTEAFAAIVILSGLAAQPQALLNRQMRFRFIAAIDAGSYLAGFAAAVVTAYALRDYWALFAAPAVGGAVTVAASWAATGWRPGWPRCQQGAGTLLRFGGGVAGADMLDFLVRNLDKLLIGRVWGAVALGAYDRAYKLLLFPLEQVNGPLSRVMLPTLARLAGQPERYRHAYLRTLRQLLLISQPGIVFMIVAADTLVPAVLGEQWRASTPIFLWLGLAALQQPMTSSVGWLLVTQGRTRAMLGWGAFNAVTCAAAFIAGLPWGAVGVAAAYAITDIVPRLPLYWWLATRYGPVRLADLCRAAWPFLVADAVGASVTWGFLHMVRWPVAAALTTGLVLSYGTAGLVLLAFPDGRAVLRQSLALVRAALQRAG